MNSSPAKTVGQVKAIFAEGRKLGLDQDELRDVVESTTRRTRSVKELTRSEADAVLQKLKGNQYVPLRTLQHRRQKRDVKQLVSKTQLKLIAELASQRGWTSEGLGRFCERVCGHATPRTTEAANKVIEGLKAMNRREGLWAN